MELVFHEDMRGLYPNYLGNNCLPISRVLLLGYTRTWEDSWNNYLPIYKFFLKIKIWGKRLHLLTRTEVQPRLCLLIMLVNVCAYGIRSSLAVLYIVGYMKVVGLEIVDLYSSLWFYNQVWVFLYFLLVLSFLYKNKNKMQKVATLVL